MNKCEPMTALPIKQEELLRAEKNMSFEEAREKVVRLLERFEENYDSRLSA